MGEFEPGVLIENPAPLVPIFPSTVRLFLK
jgi:hypothetical protein